MDTPTDAENQLTQHEFQLLLKMLKKWTTILPNFNQVR